MEALADDPRLVVPIRTPDQRLRVFVSSTLGELADERAAVRRAVEALRLTPVMFEMGARPHPPRALYRAYLQQSQVFVGLYWQRYGWVAPDEAVSGLEDEYLLSDGMPRLVYVKRPASDREPRLGELLTRIQTDDQLSYRAFADTEELEQLVKDDLVVLLSERFAATGNAPGGGSWHPTRVPLPSTPTFGRDADMAAVMAALESGTRLLTLVGPGGVGKSRLALEVCRRVQSRYADGVVFVPLESVTEPDYVMRVFARSVGAALEGNQPALDAAMRRLNGRACLLLVDNFEQVVEAAPELGRLIDACPGVQALVTSRRPLRLRGEREHPVAPLDVPPEISTLVPGQRFSPEQAEAFPSVELFVGRAQAVRPDFHLDGRNGSDVATLVRCLDGLPLALEIAAARTRVLSPGALVQRLLKDQGVLGTAAVDVPLRQRTLRTTLEWSHSLLTPSQQRLFARMSVFPDGATLDAIDAVCGDAETDVVEGVSALLENNLVRQASEAVDGQPRIAMLTTVHGFAQEQLDASDEADVLRARMVDWFVGQAQLADTTLDRAAHLAWPELLPDLRNLRAVAWLLVADGDCARLTGYIWHLYAFLWQSGLTSGALEWIERLNDLECSHADDQHRARAAGLIAMVRHQTGDFDGAMEALSLVNVEAVEASDPAAAAVLELCRAVTLPYWDRIDEALVAAENSVRAARASGFAFAEGYALAIQGLVSLLGGDIDRGLELSRAALDLGSELELVTLIAQQHGILALHAAGQGDVAQARSGLRVARDVLGGDRGINELTALLGHAAVLAMVEGRPDDAVRALSCSDVTLRRLGLGKWPLFERMRAGMDEAVAAQVGDRYSALVAEGAAAEPWALFDQVVQVPMSSVQAADLRQPVSTY